MYGYRGTGKTFLWNALAASIRSTGGIVLTVASSGIAATLLPGGRTAHSRFGIPLQVNEFSMCSMRQNSPLAELIKATKLIIWDEAPMIQRYCVEALNRSLQDVMHSSLIFGGKSIVMGGDFRQILPVIPKGCRASIVDACITSSSLWTQCHIFQLHKNMRLGSSDDPVENERIKSFSQWLLDVGDGKFNDSIDGIGDVDIPSNLLVNGGTNPIAAIVHETYDNLLLHLEDNTYFNDRAILAPTIEIVDQINTHMIEALPGEMHEFISCDSVCKSSYDSYNIEQLYTTEFLNTITGSGLPPHKLNLKVGTPVMLLRNIDQEAGLCNGTRLRVSKLGQMVIEGITLNGSKPNEKVLLHRMDMNPTESRWPFKLQRRQFPITLSFAMTINKSQGQSLKKVGLYLCKPVFTHGQLYVGLSRVRSVDGLRIVLGEEEQKSMTTKNVVYKEIFMSVYHTNKS